MLFVYLFVLLVSILISIPLEFQSISADLTLSGNVFLRRNFIKSEFPCEVTRIFRQQSMPISILLVFEFFLCRIMPLLTKINVEKTKLM